MGKLVIRAVLMDVKTGEQLWPEEETGRIVRTSVEVEQKGRSEILWRLVTAASHCVIRELYDCPKQFYKIAEEERTIDDIMERLE